MKNYTLYELTPSQDVIQLQTKYTLYKRVVNILFSATYNESIDYSLMKQAINILIKRNDCLRLRFIKQGKQLKQYIIDEYKINHINELTFSSKEEQVNWFKKKRKKAIQFLKGEVFDPYFINTYDGKCMVLFRVCHLILDLYGLNNLFIDLYNIYTSLKENKELPDPLERYEDVIINDLKTKHNVEKMKKHLNYYKELLGGNEEPYYVGINGKNDKYMSKRQNKRKRAMQMFFINNDTEGYEYEIDTNIVNKVINLCNEHALSISNVLFYACSLTASLINDNKKSMLHLQLCNRRSSNIEKNTCGCKVQSIGCYTKIDFNKSFLDNINTFSLNQLSNYKHIALPDVEFEQLVHKIYPSTMLETYYSITFSFIPISNNENIRYEIHSNGKGALPCYLALLYDVNNGNIRMCYDCQTKIINENDVINFHNKYIKVLELISSNPNIILNELTNKKASI